MKIVSLVPSITELLADLGLGDEVKGITKFCIHPSHFKKTKTIVGGTKNVHIDRVRFINPDLVIANKEENTKEQVEAIQEEFPVFLTDINNFNDALMMIRQTGKLTQREEAAESLVELINKRFTELAQTGSIRRKRVAYLIWKDPYMVAAGNTYINDMLHHCGFENAFGDLDRYPTITIDDLKSPGIDIILLSSEPYPFKNEHVQELSTLIPDKMIRLVDGEMFSWYGSRMLKAALYFSELIQSI